MLPDKSLTIRTRKKYIILSFTLNLIVKKFAVGKNASHKKVKSKQELYFVKGNYEIFSNRSFFKGKTRTEQWWAISRNYSDFWNFMRRSAILNLFAGWGVLEP